MKEKNKEIEIRRLAERWYEGTATAQETATLVRLMNESESLPDDLAADKALILGLDPDSFIQDLDSFPDMPPQYTMRIANALDNAINTETKRNQHVREASGWRKWGWAAACAVCVLGFGAGYMITMQPSEQGSGKVSGSEKPLFTLATPGNVANEDTVKMANSFKVAEKSVAVSGKVSKKIIFRKSAMDQSGYSSAEIGNKTCDGIHGEDSYPYEYLSEEEEKMLAQNNYKVVRDEEEADKILASIFGRMESNLERESHKLAKFELEYDSEIVKISDIDNAKTQIESHHEDSL